MRPRLLHLGSTNRSIHRRSLGRSFNEAEAFTPRIHGAFAAVRERGKGFNEAEAFTPRILLIFCFTGMARKYASMRPRLLHLGSRRAIGSDEFRAHRFNEAEAFTPRIRFIVVLRFAATSPRFNEAEAFTPRILPRRRPSFLA